MLTVEFEIKAFLKDEALLQTTLKKMEKSGEARVVDYYFDNQKRDLFLSSVFFRIRNNKKLDIKYDKDKLDLSHTMCNELSFDFPLSVKNAETVCAFLDTLMSKTAPSGDFFEQYGLQKFVVIDRQRITYKDEHVSIMIDRVAELGDFIEIEADQAGSSAVLELANYLSLEPIPIGYVELFLRKFDYPVYQLGKYQLLGDRN